MQQSQSNGQCVSHHINAQLLRASHWDQDHLFHLILVYLFEIVIDIEADAF